MNDGQALQYVPVFILFLVAMGFSPWIGLRAAKAYAPPNDRVALWAGAR